jgi:hypothetical protein
MTETKRWIGGIKSVHPPALWEDIERRVHQDETFREPSRRRPILAVVLLVGAVAIVGSTLYALRSLGSGSHAASPAPGEIIRYRVDGAPQPLAVGGGAAWVDVTTMSPRGTGPSTIWRIDARTGEVKPLPATTGAVWVVAGGDGVWATCNAGACGGPGVLQLDPATGDLIRTVTLPDRTSQIAAGLGSVWVSTESGVVKIDAGSGSVVATFPGTYNFLGVDGRRLWATTPQGFAELDPSLGKPLRQFPFPDPCYLDVNPTVVFVATCGGATISHDVLEAVDTKTGRVLYRVPLDGWGPMRLSDQTLLIAQHDPTSQGFIRLVQLDAATGKPAGPPFEVRGDDARFSMEALVEPNPFLAVGEGSAWFTDFGAGEVIRVGLPISGSGMPTPSERSPMPSPKASGSVLSWDETYRLSNFQIGPAATGSGAHGDPLEPNSDAVGVTFDHDWSGAVYPGEAQCRIDVMASDGTIVGSAELGIESLSPHARTFSPTRVSIDGEAARAAGSCGPGTRPTGDYRFSDITIQGDMVSMTVSWGSETPPGSAWCIATSDLADGSQQSHSLGLTVGISGQVIDMHVPPETAGFHVTCEPYTNQGQAEQNEPTNPDRHS